MVRSQPPLAPALAQPAPSPREQRRRPVHSLQADRLAILQRARSLLGARAAIAPSALRRVAPLPVDVVTRCGQKALRDAMLQDYRRRPESYHKLGGNSNNPARPSFLRLVDNVELCLRHRHLSFARGTVLPLPGTVVFFDWPGARGHHRFRPDQCGVVSWVEEEDVREVIMAVEYDGYWVAERVAIAPGSAAEQAIRAYGLLPA